ncbi:methyl-accepting chemotaxis protein [Chitinimonas taiwanensis]|uniref:Methyl-accepting chemotaxis sensory transducer with Pas/Pac sensor n=1 Tax=Chitinimonas taiwanensis DSM 18899 TaxID=1121279 RepID=A0A1K2H2Y4_9NEIS|nr:methyl-accepting chemotaxis protein [Chitinimonas taiwanensis]SFZ70078.1 methyl-accepting chemotaxis sensory transducer with Pas/Pac sensor [Chitinimonas taiwanensis DSM 18899]
MKTNLPVTQLERFLKPAEPIVTHTDLAGVITYANPAFVEISGFSHEELLGKSHNVVRHPDMPQEAFADLWQTVKDGLPWRGLVKNRCKNGDFYWVEAYVTPLRERGQVVGYMSVRNAPDRSEVARAEALYREVREKRASFPATVRGTVLQQLSFSQRAWLAFIFLALINLATGLAASLDAGAGVIWGLAGLGALAALIGGGWWISNAANSLRKVGTAIARIEEGDFRFQLKVDKTDEFSDMILSMQSLAVHLRALIADVLATSHKIADQSQHLDQSAEALAKQTGMQSEQAMQVSAATEQMSVSVTEISRATQETAESAQQAKVIVREGEANMQASRSSTGRIVEVVGEARSTLDDLNQAVARIGSMTGTIKEIADQTNLLALNAAIEAARAGESGRGFAVVADEVRKLAERTTQSTQDISNNVTNIQMVTQATLMTMDDAVSEVANGTAAIEATSRDLEAVAKASERTVAMTGQIADTLRQQSAAAEEVANTIERMAGTIDANNREAHDVASSAERLSQTAKALKALVKQFEKSI